MGVNKVKYGENVVLDISSDTVTADKLLQGYTAHDNTGTLITGTATGGGTGAISVVDTEDTHGGTIRTITAVDISDTTAVASDVAQGKYFYTADGTKTTGTASGGGSDENVKNYIERNSSISNIEIPNGVNAIGDYAFTGWTSLSTVGFPNTVTSIGAYAFRNCTNLELKNDSLPSGVTAIGNHAFSGCTSLNFRFTELPSSVTTIGAYAFEDCNSLCLSSLPNGITRIESNTFDGCYGALKISTLPDSITYIGGYAFRYCKNIQSISCAGDITYLGTSAFTGNSNFPMSIKSASFPNMTSTTSLLAAFGSTTAANACQQLEVVDIGSTTGIGANAFANCYKLHTLVLRKSSVCTLSNVSAFLNTPMRGYNSLTGTVYVPSDLISSYQTATNWSTLYNGGTVTFVAIEGSQYDLS